MLHCNVQEQTSVTYCAKNVLFTTDLPLVKSSRNRTRKVLASSGGNASVYIRHDWEICHLPAAEENTDTSLIYPSCHSLTNCMAVITLPQISGCLQRIIRNNV